MPTIFDIQAITKMLAHRYPFQMIDKILYLDDTSVTGLKNVTINEPYFQGHFPKNPIMPGVLQIESMAQTGGILVLNRVPDPENYITYLLGIDSCRFKKKVTPGDTLIIKCDVISPIKLGIIKMHAEVSVNQDLVSEATLTAQIVNKYK